jgi:AmpE protein
MTFLVILSVLALEQLLLPHLHLRRATWLGRWLELHQSLPVPETLRSGPTGLLGLLLPPLVAVAVVWMLLEGTLELAGLLFSALVLLYSLGPGEIALQVRALSEAQDTEAARPTVREILGRDPESGTSVDPRELTLGIVALAYRQTFAVLAWFLLLGPVGALLYRLTRDILRLAEQQSRHGLDKAGERLTWVLDWLPSRLLAGLFTLAGCFEPALESWRGCNPQAQPDPGTAAVVCAGAGALQLDAQLSSDAEEPAVLYRAALRLVRRTLVLLMAILGLLTLSGWLS